MELYSSDDLPFTIKTSIEDQYLDHISKLHGFLHGCNLAVRSQAFDRIGLFDEQLGAGTRLKSAEDTDLVYRAFKARMKIAYVPKVLVYHNHGRAKAAEIRRLQKDYKLGRGAFYLKNLLQGNLDVLVILYVQLRPPLRRWIKGPQRILFIRRYFEHIAICSYLLVGAGYFLKSRLYRSGGKQLGLSP